MKKLYFLLFLFIFPYVVFSQLDITVLKKENSFTGDWIKDICRDRDGNLWFGDDNGNGLMMFDGKKWTSFPVSGGYPAFIQAIAEDTSGNLWIGNYQGVYRYDKSNTPVLYTTADGLPANNVKDVLVDHNGTLWFATYSGLCRYNGTDWVTYTTANGLVSNFVTSLFEDNQNRLWISTLQGLSKLQGSFVNYTTADGLPFDGIQGVTQSTDGTIWIATGNGAASFDESDFTAYTTDDGLSSNDLSSVFADSRGNVWFTSYTPNGGIVKFDGTNWIKYKAVHGLVNNNTDCMTEDGDGNLWIGTGNGISMLRPGSWDYITMLDGIPDNSVLDIYEDENHVKWIATFGGLSRFSGSVTNYTTENGFPDNRCYKITPDNSGNLWIGTLGGAVKMSGDTFQIYNTDSGLIKNYVYDITVDGEDTWFITSFGVSRLTNGEFTNYTTGEGLVSDNNFCSLLDHSGKLWIGSLDKGVSCYDGFVWTHYDKTDGLTGNAIWEMFEDTDGNIWFATDSGVTKYNGSVWEQLTREDGLPTTKIFSIEQDDNGHMWFGCDSSKMAVYDGSTFVIYSAASQIPDVSTMVIREFNDTIYAGGTLGLVSYSYKTAWTNYIHSAMPGDTIQTLITGSEDKIWIGTYNHGIASFDGKNWKGYTTSDGLAGNTIYSLAEDHEGNIWAAVSTSGINKITGSSVEFFDGSDGLTGTVWNAVAVDTGNNIWIGSNQALNKYDGTTFYTYTTADGLPGNYINCILPTGNGDLWIGTGNGAGLFNGSWHIYNTASGLANNNVNDIIQDHEGNLWFATISGVSKFDGSTWTSYLDGVWIWSLSEDQMGNIWAGSWGNGVYVFNGRSWMNLQTSDGISGNDVRAVALQQDGKIWLGTYGNGLTSLFRKTVRIDSVVYHPVTCAGDEDATIEIKTGTTQGIQFGIQSGVFVSDPVFNYLSQGTYYPAVTNGFDTLFAAEIVVTDPEILEVDLGNDTTICQGESVVLSAPFSWNYIWNNGEEGTREIIADEAGTYSVIVTDESGCAFYDTIVIGISDPVVDLGENITLINDETETLDAGPGFESYEWSTGEETQTVLVAGTEISGPAVISVWATDAFGCQAGDSVTVDRLIESYLNSGQISLFTVYPNPASEKLFIRSVNDLKIKRIEMINSSGAVVKFDNDEEISAEIPLKGFAPGNYIIRITTEDDQTGWNRIVIR